MEPGDLLDERQAAAVLSTPRNTLRVWRTKGKGPAYVRVGGRNVRYLRADIDAFIQAGRVDPEAS